MRCPDVPTARQHRPPVRQYPGVAANDEPVRNGAADDTSRRDRHARLTAADDILRRRAGLPEEHPERRRLRDLAVEAAVPMTRSLARRFAGRGEPLADIQQVAYVGLLKAVDGFDPRYPDFWAYAAPTINGEIKRYFRDNSWAVDVPRRYKDLGGAVSQCRDQLAQELRQIPGVADFARFLGADDDEIRNALAAWRAYASLSLYGPSQRGGDGGGERLADRLGEPEAGYDRVDLHEAVHPALARLPRRERRIVTLRYFGNMTQTQIAAEVGLSQMHVSRLLARSLKQLRDALRDAY